MTGEDQFLFVSSEPNFHGPPIRFMVYGGFRHLDGSCDVIDASHRQRVERNEAADRNIGFPLTLPAAQALVDELFRLGVKPTAAVIDPGRYEAMQAHIGDLRNALNLTLPNALRLPERP